MSYPTFVCQYCGAETCERVVLDFKTRVHGVPFVVPEAKVVACKCGEEWYTQQEMSRWRKLFDALPEAEKLQRAQAEIRTLLLSERKWKNSHLCLRQRLAAALRTIATLRGPTIPSELAEPALRRVRES